MTKYARIGGGGGGGGGALQPKVDVTRNPNWGISDCKKN